MARTGKLFMLGSMAALMGCGQSPQRVFAVQIASAPPAAAAPAATRSALPAIVSAAFHPRHPAFDLNAAGLAELESIPGIDARTAAAMVAARPYASKRALLRRGILTTAEYARWKGYLVVHRRKTN
ncbi:MAG: hypothetical protein ACRD2D_10850 [Terriglobales bacterium]